MMALLCLVGVAQGAEAIDPLPPPVTARLVNDANGTCPQATYDTAVRNAAGEFRAKTQ